MRTSGTNSAKQWSKISVQFTLSEILTLGTILLTIGGSFFMFMNAIPEQKKLRDEVVNLKVSNAVIITKIDELKNELAKIEK